MANLSNENPLEKRMTQQILRIDASMRKNGSYSRPLSERLITQLKRQTPSEVKVRDLADGIPFINEAWIEANFTDVTTRTAEQRSILSCSDALVSEIKSADTLVIGLPIYNFGVPAAFKAWIDQVARANLTFKYSEDGPVGLLENKKAYVVVASGGTQVGSDIDFVTDYVRHVLGFIGIKDVTFINGSGVGSGKEEIIKEAQLSIASIR